MLKNIVYCPAGDNILAEGRISPSDEVPSGTQCEEDNILSLTGQRVKGWCFSTDMLSPAGQKERIFFWNI